MLYDKYQDKIMGVIRTIGKIRRFRVLIISVLVAVLALTAGFLVTKGTVLEDPHPEALSYGEALPQSAKALFSSVRYEYRAQGSSEWTEQAPSKVGKYTVRAVSKGSFGRVTYGKEYAFVITPQAITVHAAEEAVQYGTLPTLKAEGLCYADTAACEEFSFADTTKRSTEVTPVASSVVILNRFGEDVTDCYTITAVTSAITLNPRPITLTVASKEIEYNGQPLKADIYELTVGELVTGDSISTEFGCSQTDVGETVNEMTVCITNSKGVDVTGQYQIEQIRGLLRVVPRIVVISTGSGEYVYDGEDHRNATFVIEPSTPLLEGHEVTMMDATTIKDVGELPNRLSLDICDATGESVKDLYYEVRAQVGMLKVTPRPLTVKTDTESWVYDGETHMADGFTVSGGSVVTGHTAILENTPVLQDAGEVENQGSLRIMAGDTDVTANYAIEMSYGKLTVTKRPVQLTSPDATFVYNSEAQNCTEALLVTEGSLVEGHLTEAVYVSLTDAGAIPNSFTVTVRSAMWEDISANYSITTVFGTLTVEKRPVTLRTDSAARVYDGTVLYRDSVTVISEYGIADGEHYVVNTHTELLNVGRVVNELTVSIFEDEEDRTENYVITYDTVSPGYLEVLPRPITLITESATKVYNGLPLTCHEYTVSAEEDSLGLASGQQLANVVFTGSITDVTEGGVENTFTFTILDEAGEETVSNYAVTVICGRLTLLPRPVTFTSGSAEKIYDDTPLTHHEYTVSEAGEDVGVVSFHTATVTFTATLTDVDEIENVFTVVIKDENDRDVTQNYEITCVNGALKVTPRPITIVTGSDSKVYDDTPLYCENVTWDPVTSLLEHHIVVVTERTEQTNVAENVENRLVVSIFKGDADKTGNYEITYRYGTLTVTKRTITLITGSAERVYDDTPLYCEDITCKPADALVIGHDYVVTERTEQTDVAANVENRLVVRIFKGDVDKTENYEIAYEYGTLTVTKRPITVVTGTADKVYDDTPLYHDEVSWDPADALLAGHSYVVVERTEQTDVAANVENRVVVRIVKGEVDKTENYEITYRYGTLTVTKRPVTVVTGTADKVYDDTPLYCEDVSWDPADGLVNGHRYLVTERTEQTDAATVENKLVVRILKGDTDKSDNYEITYRYGTLTVKPRPITVVTGNAEQVYNGNPLSLDAVSVSTPNGLVSEHTLRVMSAWLSITDAGSIENAVTVSIFKGDADKTANYEITYEYGTLTVKPRPITVVTGGAEKVYDDIPLQKEEVSVLAPTGENDGLLAQHTIAVLTPFPSQTDVGVLSNAVQVAVMAGERNVSGNYEIRYQYGNLLVTPRPITVVTGTADKVYDDIPLYHDVPDLKGDYGLVTGHDYRVVMRTEQTDVTSGVENVLELRIYKGDTDKTANYEITYQNGTLTVTPRPVTVVTGSAEQVYNGLPLSATDCTAEGLAAEHSLSAAEYTELTDVGSVENVVTVRILKDDVDKTSNYEITYEYGTLTVTPRAITVTAAGAEKPYDGTPLLAPKAIAVPNADLDALNLEIGPDHRFTWSILAAEGSQTEVGESPSSIAPENIQFYFDNKPVAAGNLVVTVLEGTLTVTEAEEDDDDSDDGGNTGGGLDGDGNIDGGEIGDGESGGENENKPSARVFTSQSATIYLRAWSYGDYNGRSWSTDPTVYGPLLNNTHSMNYLTGEALAAAGFTRIEMRIESYYDDYLLPYYLSIDGHSYEIQTNDVRNSGDTGKEYALYYYAYDYLNNPTLIGVVPATYAEAEAAYSAFVHEQYLQIPAGTLSFMQGIIAEQGFDANDPEIIAKVAAFIRGVAVYDPEYDRALDDAEDIVIAFLSQYKTGICQHYASAATLLYRALGIPARYTVGYLTKTVAGEWVDVTGKNAHAWVEVYLDGIGWVQVEVTGSSEQLPDGGEDDEEDTTKTELEIYLFEIQKYYDGKPLSYEPDDWYCMTALPAGYTVLLELSGSLTDVGSLDLKELQEAHADKLTVLDADGNDVSDQYRLVLKGKPLTVKQRLLEITAGSAVKIYDGEKLTCGTYVISQGALVAGHSINERALRFDGEQTEVGESDNIIKDGSIKIIDANGNDVTGNYAIKLVKGTLTVLESEE